MNTSPETMTLLRQLPDSLSARVLGQDKAVTTLSALGRHWLAGLIEKAPRLLLLGPTGVGKTECAIALTESLYGHPPLRVDMSEHGHPDALAVLLGDRAGDPGLFQQLLSGTSPRPLLLDEIEKAHPRVRDLLLQMLEPGHLTTADGTRIDLTNTTIVCTSNVATATMADAHRLSPQLLEHHVLDQVHQELRAETLNRFDATVVFQPLNLAAQRNVLRLHLNQYLTWLSAKGPQVVASEAAERFLLLRGFDQRRGARTLRRTIRRHIGDAIVDALLRGESGSGLLVVEDQRLHLRSLPE